MIYYVLQLIYLTYLFVSKTKPAFNSQNRGYICFRCCIINAGAACSVGMEQLCAAVRTTVGHFTT